MQRFLIVAAAVWLWALPAIVHADVPRGLFDRGERPRPAPVLPSHPQTVPFDINDAPKGNPTRLRIPASVLRKTAGVTPSQGVTLPVVPRTSPPFQGMVGLGCLALAGVGLVHWSLRSRSRLAACGLHVALVVLCISGLNCAHVDRPMAQDVDVRQLPAFRASAGALSGQAVVDLEEWETVQLTIDTDLLKPLLDNSGAR